MTKSIKEKTRIEKIRYCKQHNIPVTSDLIKIDFTFKKKNLRKRKTDKVLLSTVYNPIWLKSIFINQLALVKSKLVPIARSLEVYDLTVYFNVNIKFISKSDYLDDFRCTIDLYSNRKFIGQLFFRKETINTRSFGRIFKTTKKIINKEKLEDTIQHLQFLLNNTELNFPIYRPYYYLTDTSIKSYDKFFRNNKNNKLSQIMKRMDFFRNVYDKKMNINSQINTTYIVHNNIIDIELSYYSRNTNDLYNCMIFQIDSIIYNELDFIKSLIQLEAINIDICDDDFTLENLSEIENLIKISNY